MKPSVIIAGSVFESLNQNGIWRIFYEVMSRTSGDVDYCLLLEKEPVQPVPENVHVEFAEYIPSMSRRKKLVCSGWRERRRIRHFRENSVWHSSFFEPDPLRSRRRLVTVYDMISERLWPKSESCRLKRSALQDADHVLAISDFTIGEIRSFFPSLECSVERLPLGKEHLDLLSDSSEQRNEKQFMFVGNRASYKNFDLILQALASGGWPEQMELLVVGPSFTSEEESALAAAGGSGRVRYCGRVSDEELRTLYKNSVGFIFPSKEEGFGIPVLEAQSGGCIPLLSDIAVFQEVAGKGAIFFDPEDPASLIAAMRSCLDRGVADAVRIESTINLTRYSWDDTAAVTIKAYEDLLEAGG